MTPTWWLTWGPFASWPSPHCPGTPTWRRDSNRILLEDQTRLRCIGTSPCWSRRWWDTPLDVGPVSNPGVIEGHRGQLEVTYLSYALQERLQPVDVTFAMAIEEGQNGGGGGISTLHSGSHQTWEQIITVIHI